MTILSHTHLYQEIHQQPTVLSRFFGSAAAITQQLAQAIQKRGITHVVIAARGTSDNAGRYAQYILGAINGLIVTLTTPSLFTIYQRPPRFGNALVLGISQSGKSPDIVAVLAEARHQGALTAVITNTPDSDLAQQGDFVIDLAADEEKAVAATKTYTASLAAIALLSASLANDSTMQTDLYHLPDAVTQILALQDTIAQAAPRYRYMERCVVIGRGYNYATAYETALKMKELTYTVVEPYSSADFLHGPLAVLEPGFPVIILAPSGVMVKEMELFLRPLQDRHAEIIAISDNPAILHQARIPLALPYTVPEWLSPLTTIVAGQLLAMHLAHTRDYDVDAPRGIRKVTETR
ncbi:MAG: SIS domain-containing protein [Chloroflexi bacterium]|nr:SIS domain-containing protein [Chloroflexota bacterium]MBP8054252.1 SIS domain-containing protein [Chloroflexota bacterium]